jgi:NAD(P)-dependent dehydrogenase (short-subunit alcohol dehydrogenase family)
LKAGIPIRDLSNHVAIVTGANRGIGYSATKHLVSLNCTVIMACRNMDRCNEAQSEIQSLFPKQNDLIHTMKLELTDLESVHSFVTTFKNRFSRLDYLINNAGSFFPKGSRTKQGFEESLGTMHFGHFALTRWLLDLLTVPQPGIDNILDAARVVNVASEVLLVGNFHPTIFSDSGEGDLRGEITDNCEDMYGGTVSSCPTSPNPNTNGYARAKLGNVLHMQELQRRYDDFISQSPDAKNYRRLVSVSLHPGRVSTNFISQLKYFAPFLRSQDEAAWIVIHAILDNSFLPSSFIDSMKGSHDLADYHTNSRSTHLMNYPEIQEKKDITFLLPKTGIKKFSFHGWVFDKTQFIQPMTSELQGNSNQEVVHLLQIRLWDLSEHIIYNWLQNKSSSSLLGSKAKEIEFKLPSRGVNFKDHDEEKQSTTPSTQTHRGTEEL